MSQGSSTLSINKTVTIAGDSVKEHHSDSDREEDLIVDESASSRVSKSLVSALPVDDRPASKTGGGRKSKLQAPVNSGSLKLKLPGL